MFVGAVLAWLALQWSVKPAVVSMDSLGWVFAAQAVAPVLYGVINGTAVAGGVWFRKG